MATVNQRIPNFLGGVSQQPDKIKFPGQLRVCDNAVPDITFGLKKRPPGEFVGTLTNANATGHWYEILRDGQEKYLVQITPDNFNTQPIRVWDLSTGTEQNLTNNVGDPLYKYLQGATKPYSVTTIQDYTLIANPNKTVARSSSTTPLALHNGDYGYARLDTIAYNTEYVLYNSGTNPTPQNFYRVTSVKVDRLDGGNLVGPTWDSSDTDQSKSGTLTWSFSGGDNVTGAQTDTENIEGSLQVNGTSYIDSNTANFNGNSTASEDFLGYTQNYKTRYTATVTLTDGGLIKTTSKSNAEGRSIDVSIEGITYRISVEAVEPVATYEGLSGIAYHKTPKNPDNGAISMLTILTKLKDSVNSNLTGVTAEVVGSGLFLHGINASSVNFLGGAVNENMSVIGQKAQDISRLPAMNKHGYVAQISNTADLETDDYYVKFEADNGVSGSGSYEETVRPNLFTNPAAYSGYYQFVSGQPTQINYVTTGFSSSPFTAGEKRFFDFTSGSLSSNDGVYTCVQVVDANNSRWELGFTPSGSTIGNLLNYPVDDVMEAGFDPATMPHALINNLDGTFTFAKLDAAFGAAQNNQNYWKDRQVGDDESNPFPTIIGKEITEMFFHRNRLGLIANEQIVMSQPGQYFDLFIVSAIAASDDNAIDITVSDIKPAFINHTLPINKGVMMFSDNGQFLLFTESDIFSPKTVRLKKISSYECDQTIQPLDLGTSVLFTSNVSAYARAFEATIVDDDVPPKIIEQTRVVPEFLPKDITKSTNSASIGISTYGKKNDTTVYHYKYYDAGNAREQSAWYSWTLTGTMQHMLYTAGSFFTVTFHDNTYKLCRYEYVADADSTRAYVLGTGTVGSPLETSREFEAHLDNMVIPTNVAGSVQTTTDPEKTVLRIPYVPANTTNLFMVGLSGNDSDGNSIAGTVRQADDVGSETISGVVHGTVTFNNINISSSAKVAVGYKYTSTIELPSYYTNLGNNAYDTNADLRISAINFEMGVGGPMEFHLTSPFTYIDSNGNTTKDIDDYVQFESGILSNSSVFDKPPASLTKSVRVPVQRKNEKYTLQIKIPDPFSTALISASWDGIYNPRRHVRR